MAAGRLDVLMGLDAAEFTKGLSKAEYETQKFQKSIQSSFGSIGTLLKTAFAAVTVHEIVQGFVAITGSLDDLDEAAQALGTTAVALAEFRRSALDSGVSAEKFDASLTKLAVKATDAASGGKESAAVFAAMGVTLKNTSGQIKTTDELLGEVANKFQGYADGAEKTALAVALFGKAGAAMIPFLNQGAEGLKKFSGVTKESVEAAKQLQAQFDIIKAGLSALGIELATSIIPVLSKMIQEFFAARDAAGGFFGGLRLLAKQSAETLADPGAKIQELNAELAALQATAEQSHGLFGDVDNKERIASLQSELKFLKELQRNRALANAGTPYGNEGRQALGRAPIPDAGDDKKKKEKIDENTQAYARYVEQLAAGLDKEIQLSKVQEVTRAIEQNRFGELIPQQEELLLLLAAQADAAEEYAAKIKHNAELEREQNRILLEREAMIESRTGRKADRDALRDLKDLDEALSLGTITLEEHAKAMKTFWDGTKADVKETQDVVQEFGLTFASSIGEWIKHPTSGKTFFQALLDDLLQLTTQMLIVAPLAETMKKAFSSGGGSGGGDWSWIANLFGSGGGGGQNLTGVFASGTDFVPRDGLAMVHRGEAVIPASQNKDGGGRGMNVNITQMFAPGTSRETVNQAAAAASQQLQRSNRRNN